MYAAYQLANEERWVSVSARLPEAGNCLDFSLPVLCMLDNGLQYVYSFIKHEDNKSKFYYSYGTGFDDVTDYVTHWQPLPTQPLKEIK